LENPTSVAIVILNWNGKRFLEQFLPSVLGSTYAHKTIYVADNGSTDDSINFLQKNYPQIHVLQNKKNEGFAAGYNWAMNHVKEDISILLNSDVEVQSDWIEPAIEMFSKNTKLAAVQPKILDFNNRSMFEYAGACGGWLDNFGYPFSRGRIFDSIESDKHQYDNAIKIFWASGAAMFIRTNVFKELGGFDPFFFAHQEEIDLCWRMQLAGYEIMSCPRSVVFHIGGGTLSKENPKKVFLNFRNNLIMLYKNLTLSRKIKLFPIRLLLDIISALKNCLSGQFKYCWAIIRAHFAFLTWVLLYQSKSIFPHKKTGSIHGIFKGNVAWEYFVKGKNRFSEIIST
jgi:GT2 family glycosyltransferase